MEGRAASEVDRRLVALTRAHRRLEVSLCSHLRDVEVRGLYVQWGHASTVDYARARLGLGDRRTRTLLFMAECFASSIEVLEAFERGELP